MPYVLMKMFEESPRKYDQWMQLLTLRRLEEIRKEIAASAAQSARVLEIGCGPGALAALLAEHGANVVAIDTSEEMLRVAGENLEKNGLASHAEFIKLSALEIEDRFRGETFHQVISILVLSELTDDETDCVLRQCQGLLAPSGKLLVVDEVEPKTFFRRWFFRALRYPVRLVTFLALQAKDLKRENIWKKVLYYVIEFPLMLLTFLVVPAATRPLANLASRIESAGFRLTGSKRFLGGTLEFLQAERTA